ncbi:3,4-dihydroxy-2-butanone-4-phosphate synthase [Rhizorhabdus argentea]|uniref:3,4-dihydroxy-2-butanone-4-phosphate synthase n=1 Tax=Rhizorhabdus argentea TaxID=1387174 RepID=UPI0030ED8C7A
MMKPTDMVDPHSAISSTEEIIEEARNGRMFILVDDEDRENEGDLVIPAQFATPDVVNFMATHGRGLICLALPLDRVKALGLDPMRHDNNSRLSTAFTVSIEAREGITTGISAADRARTIQIANDPTRGRDDIVSPGHVFPLTAREGGVLVRAGHTEAAVDVARLAGVTAAGVICEIMNADGTMARLPDLVSFAQIHGLKVGTIADLIAYRRRKDTILECTVDQPFQSEYGGDWRLRVYLNATEQTEHLALVKGVIDPSKPVMVRVHAINLLEDLFGLANGRAHQLNATMMEIARYGSGAVVMPREGEGSHISQYLAKSRADPVPGDGMLRAYGLGCLMLSDIGVREMILLTNSKTHSFVGLEGFGLRVVGEQPIPPIAAAVPSARQGDQHDLQGSTDEN